ncbi:hypothetical protein IscW_ISCW011937 [Ixodes scapularis]|uniref:Uncharacterized protein n=1 Tax=Ixodes scapularis TaxID=6945 RepID=B7QC55_IXOSC|nr:hypothetical protein IscW_ISCW011937 [Ixodes scapularis]|eukprot:XP_002413119.1 hypothetical protein IscW_ISCW011937 [Ixodes scapularis]
MVLGETEVAQTVEPVKLPPEEEKPKDWEQELMSTCFQKHFGIRRNNCIVYHYPTTVNGIEYLRHPMACGGEANEFTLYGDVFIPDLTIPCRDMETPFTVNLNGPVLYNDKYTIKFIPKPPAKMYVKR